MNNQFDEIKKVFIENSTGELENLKSKLADCKFTQPDNFPDDLVNDVFTTMHSISGTSGMLGLDELAPQSRKLEIVFGKIRNGEKRFSEQIKLQAMRSIDSLIDQLSEFAKEMKN